MNKAILALSLFSASLFPVSAFYKEYRADMKRLMYWSQEGLMKEAEYTAFIEPYLQEAEKTLKVIQYCQENEGSALCSQYMMELQRYNVACFHNIVQSSIARKYALTRCDTFLRDAIQAIKNEGKIEDLDVQEELKKTSELIQRANKAYYKKLNAKAKMALWFRSHVFGPIV